MTTGNNKLNIPPLEYNKNYRKEAINEEANKLAAKLPNTSLKLVPGVNDIEFVAKALSQNKPSTTDLYSDRAKDAKTKTDGSRKTVYPIDKAFASNIAIQGINSIIQSALINKQAKAKLQAKAPVYIAPQLHINPITGLPAESKAAAENAIIRSTRTTDSSSDANLGQVIKQMVGATRAEQLAGVAVKDAEMRKADTDRFGKETRENQEIAARADQINKEQATNYNNYKLQVQGEKAIKQGELVNNTLQNIDQLMSNQAGLNMRMGKIQTVDNPKATIEAQLEINRRDREKESAPGGNYMRLKELENEREQLESQLLTINNQPIWNLQRYRTPIMNKKGGKLIPRN